MATECDRIRSYAEGGMLMGGHQGKFIIMSIDTSVPGCANQSLSQGVLTLYETKQLTMTELQWFTMNYAVRDAAIAWKRKLLPDHADAARNMSQIIWKRRTDAEEHFAARLSDLRDFTRKANSSTVAYAAAYLDHFRTRAPNLTTMVNLEVDKFLVQFLEARVLRPEAGTDDD